MSETPIIAWFDPGRTTGAAWVDLANFRFHSAQFGRDELQESLEATFNAQAERTVFGYERYIQTARPRPGSKAEHSEQAIAAIRRYAKDTGIPVLRGMPSSARLLGNPVFVRRMGWHKPGHEHANDAAQHLLSHLLCKKPIPRSIRERLFPGY